MSNPLLTLIREQVVKVPGGENFTPGKLYYNGVFYCFTCEDEDRFLENHVTEKIYGRTAIPRGRYRVTVTMSKRFGKPLPLVNGTEPLFSGIRLHGGNRAEDSLGCILVGKVRTATGIAQCADTIAGLTKMIQSSKAPFYLEIK